MHPYRLLTRDGLDKAVQEALVASRGFCAGGFRVRDANEEADIPLDESYHGHPSLRGLLADGFQVVSF